MGTQEVEQFLTYLAVNGRVASSTQNQALSAILFMYKEVLKIELPWLSDVTRAKRPEKIPLVFSKNETRKLLANLDIPISHPVPNQGFKSSTYFLTSAICLIRSSAMRSAAR